MVNDGATMTRRLDGSGVRGSVVGEVFVQGNEAPARFPKCGPKWRRWHRTAVPGIHNDLP